LAPKYVCSGCCLSMRDWMRGGEIEQAIW